MAKARLEGVALCWVQRDFKTMFGQIHSFSDGLIYHASAIDIEFDDLGRRFLVKNEPVTFKAAPVDHVGRRPLAVKIQRSFKELHSLSELTFYREICICLDNPKFLLRMIGGWLEVRPEEQVEPGQVVECSIETPKHVNSKGNFWATKIRVLAESEDEWIEMQGEAR